MTKDEFIQTLTVERKKWENRWKGIDLFNDDKPSEPGKMNMRDVLYHVAWYEREMVDVLQLHVLAGSPWWDLTEDERNAHIMEEGQSICLLEAYTHEQQIYTELIKLLNNLDDREFDDASFFRDMPTDWKPWEMLASNTYQHYPDHFQDIE